MDREAAFRADEPAKGLVDIRGPVLRVPWAQGRAPAKGPRDPGRAASTAGARPARDGPPNPAADPPSHALRDRHGPRRIRSDTRPEGALIPIKVRGRPAITTPSKVGERLRAIDEYPGDGATCAVLKLAPLVLVRPAALRGAKWHPFDCNAAEWRIPSARRRVGEEHFVPPSDQPAAILREREPITGSRRSWLPSLRTRERPMSEDTLNATLWWLGFAQDEMTARGWRARACAVLNEPAFPPDGVDLPLAHAERNKIRAARGRGQRLEERRTMMQTWAECLDGLKGDGSMATVGRCAAFINYPA